MLKTCFSVDRLDFCIGDFCRFIREPSSNIFVVAFSGANVPQGKFNYTNAFLGAKFNVIYLNDSLDGYYQNGIKGLGDDLPSTIKTIRSLINEFSKESRIFTFGCSMGGYGAILYGSLLDAEAVLAFGPAIPKFSSPLRGKDFYKECVNRFFELNDVFLSSSVKSVIFFGDRSLMDICSQRFFSCNSYFSIVTYENMCHALVYFFSQRESLSDMMTRFIMRPLEFKLPDFGVEKYSESSVDDVLLEIAGLYFSAVEINSVLVDDLLIGGFGGLAVYSAIADSYVNQDLKSAKLFFFKSLEFGINANLVVRIVPFLNDSEKHEVFIKFDLLMQNNPALIGFDSSEKWIMAKVYDDLFKFCVRYDSNFECEDGLDGYFDKYDGELVRGWAYDVHKYPLQISIYANDSVIKKVAASDFRGDLKNKGKGAEGCCAFSIKIDVLDFIRESKNSSPVKVYIRDEMNRDLKYSGSYLKRPVILSSLDVNHNGLLSGWVANVTYPNIDVDYYLYVNGRYCMKFTADVYRGDVVSKGLDMAKGFKIDLKPFCKLKEKNVVDIMYGDSLTVFSNLQLSGV